MKPATPVASWTRLATVSASSLNGSGSVAIGSQRVCRGQAALQRSTTTQRASSSRRILTQAAACRTQRALPAGKHIARAFHLYAQPLEELAISEQPPPARRASTGLPLEHGAEGYPEHFGHFGSAQPCRFADAAPL